MMNAESSQTNQVPGFREDTASGHRDTKPPYSLRIDVFSHIIPPAYKKALYKMPASSAFHSMIDSLPSLTDLDVRFRIMDKYDGLMQVLTLASPSMEAVADTHKSADLAKAANDAMAELVFKYPNRFPAAVAALPMNNMDAALQEVDRAINELKFRGVQVYTPINDKPLDSPEFIPLYEKMSQYNLPIWLHPARTYEYPDYRTEDKSMYDLAAVFGWPYETSISMARLVFSGILEKYPDLKIITHHCGAMVPFFEQRIACLYDVLEMVQGAQYKRGLTKAPLDYFRMFHNDTALYGNTSGLMCGYAFFGADHILFGTDMIYNVQFSDRVIRQTINAIEQMDISDIDKKKIFEDNARRLLRLPV